MELQIDPAPSRSLLASSSSSTTARREMPSTEMVEAMTNFNESLSEAGILLTVHGLQVSRYDSARVVLTSDPETNPPAVVKGPFPSPLVAAYWIIRVKDAEEAIDCVKKCPIRENGVVVEIRRIADMEDFGEQFTPELREREAVLRKEAEERS